jgi:hypothetical protein
MIVLQGQLVDLSEDQWGKRIDLRNRQHSSKSRTNCLHIDLQLC